jgi:hypothetical protein
MPVELGHRTVDSGTGRQQLSAVLHLVLVVRVTDVQGLDKVKGSLCRS